MTDPIFRDALLAMIETKGPVMSRTYILGPRDDDDDDEEEEEEDEEVERPEESSDEEESSAESSDEEGGVDDLDRAMTLFFPVFEDEEKTNLVGSVSLELVFGNFLSGYLSHEGNFKLQYDENVFDTDEVDAVLENTCGQVFTTAIESSK
jgi:hypothetical protein